MCCNKRSRAVRYQQANPMTKAVGVSALVGAINEVALRSQHMPPQYPSQALAYPIDYKGFEPKEAPPAYERVAAENAPEVAIRELASETYKTVNEKQQPVELPSHLQTSNPTVSKLVEGLTAAMVAYKAGSGRQRHVRRAQKALRNELYEEEVTRREAMYGRLRCGERCEIWRDVKAINFGY